MSQKINISSSKDFDISWVTIFRISITIMFLYFLFLVRDIIIWFVFALVISILFEPIIKASTKRKIPRSFVVVAVYFLIFGGLGYFIYLVTPFFISEIQTFTNVLPQQISEYFVKISPFFEGLGVEAFSNVESFLNSVQDPLNKMSGNIFTTLISFFGGIFATFFTISLAVFLSLEGGLMEKGIALFFPRRYEDYLVNLWIRSKQKVTGWFLMRIIGVIFVGFSSFIVFKILGIEYPVTFAIIAGIFDFIPIVGPLIASIIIFAAVSMDSFVKAGFVFVAFGIIQLIENSALMPALSRKMIRVPPVVVLIGLFIGGKLWGALGAVLLVPLVAILFEFFRDLLKEKKDYLIVNAPPEEVLSDNETEEVEEEEGEEENYE
jgi:predicted PurR-regulated permease PerM